jgi:2-polyprenyl-6-hydroxyphenyl methylase/3-demethylubiquinone-9 3-methyltransferase
MHSLEIRQKQRFTFGDNWQSFLATLSEERIAQAETALLEYLGRETLDGLRFLDVGCGSGLFSLAARRLGATVHSFDYDPQSVACAARLRQEYFPGDGRWTTAEGSVLDRDYLNSLGTFDIVYAWGVLHHTGAMWDACANVAPLVRKGGKLFLALYNDQGVRSDYWKQVKRLYNQNAVYRTAIVAVHAPSLVGLRWLLRSVRGKGRNRRGMSLWHDFIDWVGGYPFEVARPEQVTAFYTERGFVPTRQALCGGKLGCNEFVFEKAS